MRRKLLLNTLKVNYMGYYKNLVIEQTPEPVQAKIEVCDYCKENSPMYWWKNGKRLERMSYCEECNVNLTERAEMLLSGREA